MGPCQVQPGKYIRHTVSCITCAVLGTEDPGPGKLPYRGEAEGTDFHRTC